MERVIFQITETDEDVQANMNGSMLILAVMMGESMAQIVKQSSPEIMEVFTKAFDAKMQEED